MGKRWTGNRTDGNDWPVEMECLVATHLDVLIIGAGLSGVGSAVHLTKQCPWAEFAILDAFDGHGGTWRSNPYPGARSDTDLFTYGFSFEPWEGAPIARGGPIRDYIGEVIDEHGLQDRIQYSRQVTTADWSAKDSHWVVTAIRRDGGTIGSSATAVTIIPALSDTTAPVTQLKRSPTYFVAAPNENELATRLRKLDIPKEWIHEIVPQQVLSDHDDWVRHSLANPEDAKNDLLAGVRAAFGGELTNSSVPQYKPWRQRVCYVPDTDYFDAIRSGRADVVTDEIDAFVPEGVRLKSGAVLDADVIVTATGFNVSAFGDISISQDGVPLDMRSTVTYRGSSSPKHPTLLGLSATFDRRRTRYASTSSEHSYADCSITCAITGSPQSPRGFAQKMPTWSSCPTWTPKTSTPATYSAGRTLCPKEATSTSGVTRRTTGLTRPIFAGWTSRKNRFNFSRSTRLPKLQDATTLPASTVWPQRVSSADTGHHKAEPKESKHPLPGSTASDGRVVRQRDSSMRATVRTST